MRAEKRRFLRHPIKVPITFRQVGSKDTFQSHSADLSEGGLHFFWQTEIPRESSLRIAIPVGDRVFRLIGRVVYSIRDWSTGLYRTGVSFQDGVMAFRAKLAGEILRIQKFREETARTLGRVVSEEEAALEWIRKYAKKFAALYQS